MTSKNKYILLSAAFMVGATALEMANEAISMPKMQLSNGSIALAVIAMIFLILSCLSEKKASS